MSQDIENDLTRDGIMKNVEIENVNDGHRLDQLPHADGIFSDRGPGRVLSGSTMTEADNDQLNPRRTNSNITENKTGGCLWRAVKILLFVMSIATGFALAFLLGEIQGEKHVTIDSTNGEAYVPASKKDKTDDTDREKIPIAIVPTEPERLDVTKEDLVENKIAIYGGTEFENKNSFQSKALDVLIENGVSADDDPSTVNGAQKLAQRYALLCMYYSTNGVRTDVTDAQFGYGTTPRWHNKNVPAPWKFQWLDDECDWSGVSCDAFGLVKRIELVNHLLTGFLPMELELLNGGPIEVLDFSDNRGLGEGGFPNVFAEFNSLESVGLQGTSFVGRVPDELCQGQIVNNLIVDCSKMECDCCSPCDR